MGEARTHAELWSQLPTVRGGTLEEATSSWIKIEHRPCVKGKGCQGRATASTSADASMHVMKSRKLGGCLLSTSSRVNPPVLPPMYTQCAPSGDSRRPCLHSPTWHHPSRIPIVPYPRVWPSLRRGAHKLSQGFNTVFRSRSGGRRSACTWHHPSRPV